MKSGGSLRGNEKGHGVAMALISYSLSLCAMDEAETSG